MKKTTKTILSFLLILAMMFSFVPFASSQAIAGENSLTPPDKTVTVDGDEIAVLSKTAERTAADQWTVTLGVQTKDTIERSPLYMEFCLDLSGSMVSNNLPGGETRFAGLKSALQSMLETLKNSDAEVWIHITTFGTNVAEAQPWTKLTSSTNVTTIVNSLNQQGSNQSTNMTGGVAASYTALSQKQDGTRVLTFMGDGAPYSENQRLVQSTNSYPSRFWAAGITTYGVVLGSEEYSSGDMFIRSLSGNPKYDGNGNLITSPTNSAYYVATGLTDYTDPDSEHYVPSDKYQNDSGSTRSTKNPNSTTYFYYSGSSYVDNRFKYDTGNYFSASNTAMLSVSFQEIAEKSVAMVIDPAGSGFGSANVISVNGQYFSADDTVTWTPETTEQMEIQPGENYEMVYTVTLDKDSLNIADTGGVYTEQPLNGDAILQFTYGGTQYKELFPLPKADFEIAELQVNYSLNGTAMGSSKSDYLIVDWEDTSFDFVIPETVALQGGALAELDETGSSYTVNGVSKEFGSYPLMDSGRTITAPEAGVHVLNLNYTESAGAAYHINLTVGNGGSAGITGVSEGGTIESTVKAHVLEDGSAVITITPASGNTINTSTSSLAGGTLSGPDANGTYTLTLSDIEADKNVNIQFKEASKYTVTAVSSDTSKGTVSPGSASVYSGLSTSFTATPAENCALDSVETNNENAIVTVVGNQITVSGVTGNVTVTVKFIALSHTVTYDPGQYGTGSFDPQEKLPEEDLTLSSGTYTRTGYTQVGWATQDGGAKVYDLGGTYSADEDVTLYPVWEINKYPVNLEVNNEDYGSVSQSKVSNVPYGTVISNSENTININGNTVTATPKESDAQYTYTFDSWTNGTETVTGETTVTAVFKRTVNKYDVEFEGGSAEDIEYGKTVTVVPNGGDWEQPEGWDKDGDNFKTTLTGDLTVEDPEREGYDFTGWTKTIDEDGNVILTAGWEVNKFTVTVNAAPKGYGTVSQGSVAEVPYGTAITNKDNTITVNGTKITATPKEADAQYTYTFKDWTNGTATVNGNTSVTANFTRTVNKYDVEFEGGSAEDIEYGKTVTVVPNGGDWEQPEGWDKDGDNFKTTLTGDITVEDPEREGHEFTVWTKTIDEDGNVTLTANWDINEFTVTVNADPEDYGTVSKNSVSGVPYGTVITNKDNTITVDGTKITATPKEADAQYTYSFDGWTNGTATVNGNTSVTAKFKRTVNKYDIEFEGGPAENIEYGKTVTVNPNGGDWEQPEGWDKDGDNFKTTLTGDLTVADPEKEGYTFTEWTKTIDEDGNVTLTANWALNIYTVTVKVNSEDCGSVDIGSVKKIPYGAEITNSGNTVTINGVKVTATPKEADAQYTYSFANWSNAKATVTGDMTVTANFIRTINKYDVEFEGGSAEDIKYGKDVTVVPNGGDWEQPEGWDKDGDNYKTSLKGDLTVEDPVREGYEFTGWEKVVDNAGNVILTAAWKLAKVPAWLNGKDHFAYIIGRDDGLVHPEANITRAEVAVIFFRLLDDDIRSEYLTKTNSFPDVKDGAWYTTAISTMENLGILKGCPDGTFRPDSAITRAEFTAIAARFFNYKAEKMADFSDIKGHWAEEEISKAFANGWVLGYPDGTFKPDQNITRAEAMTVINRVLNRNPEKPADLLKDMIQWPDNADTSAWYYLAIQEATNSHDYERKANDSEQWTKITAPRDWKEFERN